jgi:tRNA pseudouridine55 synthase
MLILHKERGETPLERIDRFRLENLDYKDLKMTYAGRLDPLASGVLLILVGEECKNKEEYLGLDKEYVFEVLFGFETDTFDVLGRSGSEAPDGSLAPGRSLAPDLLSKIAKTFVGKIKQAYPPYSSKTVSGKALFQWAREDRLDEIELPEHDVEVYSLDFLGTRFIEKEPLQKEILRDVAMVKGDFRQDEISELWKENLAKSKENHFLIASFRVHCSSGTYIRSIASDMGKKLGCGAIAWSIERTRIQNRS